jgi:pimeloyl-ACP methyl ester carboxylesterase
MGLALQCMEHFFSFYSSWFRALVLCLISRLPETLERLAKKLESVYQASGGKKINIISHSMGGLLVKCFMSLHSDVNFPHRLLDQCSVLIFLIFGWLSCYLMLL